jgi:RNA polymerase sigma-70 factor, ECF subfamily
MNHIMNLPWSFFQHELRGFVRKHVKDHALAEDIVHDVFIKAHNNLPRLKDPAKVTGWIYQITRNAIHDYFRKQKKEMLHEAIDWNHEENNFNDCVARCLKNMVAALPEKYRVAFLLAEVEQVSQIELAQRMGISYSGLKSRVQRARQILRKKLDESLILETDRYGNIILCQNKVPCNC